MGVQFCRRFEEILAALSGSTRPYRRAMLFASWGCRSVAVALSLNAPYESSQQCSLMDCLRSEARAFHLSARGLVLSAQEASCAPVVRA
jgi:hypothetical protein